MTVFFEFKRIAVMMACRLEQVRNVEEMAVR